MSMMIIIASPAVPQSGSTLGECMTPQVKSAIKLIDTLIELVAPLDPELGRHLAADWGRWDDNAKRNKAALRKSIGGLLQIVMALLPHGLPASPLQAKARAACEEYIEYATGELHY